MNRRDETKYTMHLPRHRFIGVFISLLAIGSLVLQNRNLRELKQTLVASPHEFPSELLRPRNKEMIMEQELKTPLIVQPHEFPLELLMPRNKEMITEKDLKAPLMVSPPEFPSELYIASNDHVTMEPSKSIRRWGCNNTATPFIFVHIGKSGGGSVRARLAVSSYNVTWEGKLHLPHAYYPVDRSGDGEAVKARFCNSGARNARPDRTETYEGTHPCNATTPVGQAIACPFNYKATCLDPCLQHSSCPVVYTGHNLLGAEMHWLNPQYLKRWWISTWGKSDYGGNSGSREGKNAVERLLGSLTGNWCHESKPPYANKLYHKNNKLYNECSVPLQGLADRKAAQALVSEDHGPIVSWASVYASLPLLRVTVIREPFSWLVSKFFWHGVSREENITCDSMNHGWAGDYAMRYIFYLCGEDCVVRWSQSASLQELELQAEQNLRHSFAVVGLLNETDLFLDMVSARVQYIDTSLHTDIDVSDRRHSTGDNKNAVQCKNLYKDPDFQAKFMAAVPEVAVLVRLFKVGVEVNRFQLAELQECSANLQSFSDKP